MGRLVLQPTAIAQWQALVTDAKKSISLKLSEELESYLVFLLMRFSEHPELLNKILALDFLASQTKWGEERKLALREVGDICLLYAGLFPGKARKKRVTIRYYIKLGQSAYTTLSIFHPHDSALLYKNLSLQFVTLIDILQSIRGLDTHSKEFCLDLMEAHDLWTDSDSAYAYHILQNHFKNKSILPSGSTNYLH